ncbi:hypothetical protein ACNSTQ_18535 [Alkalihalobacterium sp. APHAB7]
MSNEISFWEKRKIDTVVDHWVVPYLEYEYSHHLISTKFEVGVSEVSTLEMTINHQWS